jgi:hypothetical protein
MKLIELATAAAKVVGILTGAAPVITTVTELAGVLGDLKGHLDALPTDPVTGQPLTLEQAQAHLAGSQSVSQAQDDTIRQTAEQILAENAAADGKTKPT